MPFFSFNQRDVILARQNNGTKCETEIGWGKCRPGECPGYSGSKNCTGSDLGCCLLRECKVAEGYGYCRSKKRNGCADGRFFAGTGPPWPCPGDDDTVCCVKFENFINGTSTTTTSGSSSTTEPTTESATSSIPPTSASPTVTVTGSAGSSMGGGQIAGTVVGSVAGVAILIVLGVFLFFRRRKAKQPALPNEIGDGDGDDENRRAEMPDSAGMRVRPAMAASPGGLVEAPSDVASDKDEKKHPEELSTVFNSPRELDSTPLSPVELDASPRPTGDDKT